MALDLEEAQVAVNVHLCLFVVQHFCSWHNLTVLVVVVEEGKHAIQVRC